MAGKGTFVIDGRVSDIIDDTYGNDNKPKRTLVISTDNGWWRDNEFNSMPQQVPVEFVGKSVDVAMQVQVGDLVRIDGNLSGREYQGRYYSNLEGRDIAVLAGGAPDAVSEAVSEAPQAQGQDPDDDLPF